MSTPISIRHGRLKKLEEIQYKLRIYREELDELKKNHKKDSNYHQRVRETKMKMMDEYKQLKGLRRSNSVCGENIQTTLNSIEIQRQKIKEQNEKNLIVLSRT